MPGPVTLAILAAAAMLSAQGVEATPRLRSADVRITMVSAIACDVTMTLTAEGVSGLDHRIETFEGSHLDLIEVQGAQQVGDTQPVGRTTSLVLQPLEPTYRFRYRVVQPAHRDHRCPLWVPVAPTDGRSRPIRLEIEIPAATIAGRSMPAVSWTGTRGIGTLGHVPAFVRIPFSSAGEPAEWDISRTMDVVTMTLFVGASALWFWRRRR
jgi:hypothetical protein